MQIIHGYLGNPFLIGREEITGFARNSRTRIIMCLNVCHKPGASRIFGRRQHDRKKKPVYGKDRNSGPTGVSEAGAALFGAIGGAGPCPAAGASRGFSRRGASWGRLQVGAACALGAGLPGEGAPGKAGLLRP